MMRKLAAIPRYLLGAALLGLWFPLHVFALGLGDIEVFSALNEPLNAQIRLLSVPDSEVGKLRIRLASQEAFERAGLERTRLLTQLSFAVVDTPSGPAVKVTTSKAVREPFINFLVEVEWSRGRQLREYTILLDPPSLMAGGAGEVQAPVVSSEPPQVAGLGDDALMATYGPTKSHDTLWNIASGFRPDESISVRDMIVMLRRLNPHAFNADGELMTGQMLRLPDIGHFRGDLAEAGYTPPAAQPAEPAMRGRVERMTKRGDTLWEIATEVRPDSSVTVQQTMLALLRLNPEAFYDNNVNRLKAGYVLREPSADEIHAISQSEAIRVVREQNQLWREYRERLADRAPYMASEPQQAVEQEPVDEMPAEPVAPEETRVAATPGEEEGRLELLSPDATADQPDAEGAPGAESNAEVKRLEQELAFANELAESRRLQNEELNARLTILEEQTQKLQRLLTIKDEELAALQQRVQALQGGAAAKPKPKPEMKKPAAAKPAVSKPAPKPVKFPPPQAKWKEPSFLDMLMEEDSMLFILAPLLVLLGGVVIILVRRRRAQAGSGSGEKETARPREGGLAALLRGRQRGAQEGGEKKGGGLATLLRRGKSRKDAGGQEAAAGAAQAAQTATVVMDTTVAEAMPTPQARPPAEGADTGQEQDVLAQADLYMTYGRYQEAEDLLKGAVEEEPGRADLKLKLLEVYHGSGNQAAFEALARDFHEQTKGDASAGWSRVEAMGREIAPANPLFAVASAGAAASVSQPVEPEPDLADLDLGDLAFDVPDLSELDQPMEGDQVGAIEGVAITDLDVGLDQGGQSSADAGQAGEADTAAGTPIFDADMLAGLDFGSTPKEAAEAAEPAREPPPAQQPEPSPGIAMETVSQPEDTALANGLDSLLAGAESGGQEDNSIEFDLDDDFSGLDEDTAPLTDAGEVNTKLDLAKAYIDMGDPEGARTMLDEVMEEGNAEQRKEAEALLATIADMPEPLV